MEVLLAELSQNHTGLQNATLAALVKQSCPLGLGGLIRAVRRLELHLRHILTENGVSISIKSDGCNVELSGRGAAARGRAQKRGS